MENFVNNLKTLSSKYTQKQIAKDTGVSPASIANYVAGTSEPSVSFLISLKKAYNIDIDNFLTSTIILDNDTKSKKYGYQKFVGHYIVYYYNSSAYKGKIGTYNYNILTFGVISVYENPNLATKGISARGLFMHSRENVEKYLDELNTFENNCEKIEKFYEQFPEHYKGDLEQNSTELFISLGNNNDKCLIILNNPPSSKQYVGGLGTVNSISRGREHAPCVQYIILSRNIFKMPDGEIYNLLSLGSADINVSHETNDIIELFKSLYLSDIDTGLNKNQKHRIIEDTLSTITTNIVNANMFRFAKVSNFEDDNYYRIIKDEDNE